MTLPFICKYCGGNYCVEHHLPEKHECEALMRGVWRPKPLEIEIKPKITMKMRRPFKVYNKSEMINLTIAILVIFLVETGHELLRFSNPLSSPIIIGILIGLIAGMVFHEVAHRQIARNYGLWAKFMIDYRMMLVSLMTAFIPTFKIIAPGYVGIGGFPTLRQQGKIAAAGPLTNITLALMFIIIRSLSPLYWSEIFKWAAIINLDISIFNLLPIPPLDGSKIISWKFNIWLLIFISAAIPWIILRWVVW